MHLRSWPPALDPWLPSTSRNTVYNGALRSSSCIGQRAHVVASRDDEDAVASRRRGVFLQILPLADGDPLRVVRAINIIKHRRMFN